ncbi:hypothetical protein AQUCO_02500237v1 [Aquilegia coerulea]|uniref:Uncharacterized protein n=1 Tax=Aquilegia coerulea TaxID=218851 RepID=A0A2G5DA48_AQUCA|nr:hypothetical protein AQUCO_02500237v1 [Aquilegia coerulea]
MMLILAFCFPVHNNELTVCLAVEPKNAKIILNGLYNFLRYTCETISLFSRMTSLRKGVQMSKQQRLDSLRKPPWDCLDQVKIIFCTDQFIF